MLNSEVRRRRWYLVSMATSGNSRQIYNWNATLGLGCAPALSWLPYIQNGIPVHNARSHDREGQTYIAILASEYLAERCRPNLQPGLFKALLLCCLRACVRGCVPVDLAEAPRKVGLRACNSRPSVWPPLAHKPKWVEGRPLWQKASQQTKPLNIPSKSIKASRDRPGLIVGVWYYRSLQGRILVLVRKLEVACGKAGGIERLNTRRVAGLHTARGGGITPVGRHRSFFYFNNFPFYFNSILDFFN